MFYGFVITESGNALLASMVAGQTMTITKAVVGEGTADNPDAARKLTDLITPGPTATSTRPTVDGNSVNMIVEYRSDLNGGLKEGFWIGEFGIFGKVGDGEEAMIGYGSLGDAKQYVSAYVEGTAPDVRRYPVSITVTTGVQVNVDYPAEAWMTAEDVDDKVNKHNSSEESHQDIRASLSNKAPAGYGLGTSASPISYGDILEVMRSLKTGWYSGMNVANAPTTVSGGAGWYIFEVVAMNSSPEIYSICIATNPYTKTRYLGVLYANDWSGWTELLSAGTPKEYDLLLSDGISIYSSNSKTCYSKNGFGMVMVNFAVKKTDGTPFDVGQITVAKLPDGYVPDKRIYGVCGHNLLRPSLVVVRSQSEGASAGNIVVYITESVSIIEGTIMFYVNS